jgi:hypothetical protein
LELPQGPGVQVMQVPLDEQIWPMVPQLVPEARLPVSLHTGAPVEQSVCAVLQGPLPVQLAPWGQATQLPLGSQTCPVPQLVPGDLLDESLHVGVLPEQSCVPFLQGPLPKQAAPCWHAAHMPVAPQS